MARGLNLSKFVKERERERERVCVCVKRERVVCCVYACGKMLTAKGLRNNFIVNPNLSHYKLKKWDPVSQNMPHFLYPLT